jgi:hypothetical protein
MIPSSTFPNTPMRCDHVAVTVPTVPGRMHGSSMHHAAHCTCMIHFLSISWLNGLFCPIFADWQQRAWHGNVFAVTGLARHVVGQVPKCANDVIRSHLKDSSCTCIGFIVPARWHFGWLESGDTPTTVLLSTSWVLTVRLMLSTREIREYACHGRGSFVRQTVFPRTTCYRMLNSTVHAPFCGGIQNI